MDQELKQYLDAKFAEQDAKFTRDQERVETRFARDLERVETALLTEFQQVGVPR